MRTKSTKNFVYGINYWFPMHAHKNLSYCPAVILNDEVISDNPEGGTGKGIFMNALGHMKKLVTIDGKAFTFERSFAYQLVSADTQILCFDDVKKYFDFERLFSVVTEGLTLEKKNKDTIKIPFNKSPKIAITTNYAIRGRVIVFLLEESGNWSYTNITLKHTRLKTSSVDYSLAIGMMMSGVC